MEIINGNFYSYIDGCGDLLVLIVRAGIISVIAVNIAWYEKK